MEGRAWARRFSCELRAAFAVGLLLILIVASLPALAKEVVHFPDPNLEAAIREAIGKPTGDIYDTDLIGLTYLDASNRGISNLEGIQYCTNLQDLVLHNNRITDISPLSGLTNLQRLVLEGNQISDISPLSGLTNLQDLDLIGNQINDISPLASLIHLKELWLGGNQISDISPLASLTNLQTLDLGGNQISDISPLSGLINLQTLWLDRNQISDISPLASLTNLQTLWLDGNQISDISPLSGLRNLQRLKLEKNQISDISPLSGLTNLQILKLKKNQISDISPLSSLTNLQQLHLGWNQITDISPLAGLTNLWCLDLDENQISDISPLAGLTNLASLDLSFNQITDISLLAGLTNLTWLYLDGNQISDISPLSGLTNLNELVLHDNQLTDISPLVNNPGISSGDHVDVRWNYLDLTPGSQDMQDIQALIDRGVIIVYEPQNSGPEDTTQPAAVGDLSVSETTGNSVTLTWTAPGDDGNEGTASQYDIRYSTSKITDDATDEKKAAWWDSATQCKGESTPQAAGSSESCAVTGLSPGTTYYFMLKTADEVPNWSDLSNVASGTTAAVDTTPPKLIQDFRASDGEDGKSTLSWTNPPDGDLTRVVVRRKAGRYPTEHTDGTLVYQDTSPAPGKDVIYIDTGLTNGETYYYAVFSHDATGNWNNQVEEGKNADTGTPQAGNQPPDTEIKTADIDPSKGTATFTWTGTDDTTPTKDLLYHYRLARPSATGPSYDKWSTWSSGKTKTYTNLPAGNYKFEVKAKDKDGAIDPSPASKEFVIAGEANHAPIARASDISGQPKIMHPDTVYNVTAKYFDPDGRDDLKICYLQLKHPEKRLTMMWYQEDGHTSTYAGEGGENYLSNVSGTAHEITDADGTEGYEIKWTFKINNKWPEVHDAIDFGVIASDDEGLESRWDYDNTSGTFVLEAFKLAITSPLEITPVKDAHYGGDILTAKFTITNRGTKSVTFDVLVVGGRGPHGGIVDFDKAYNVTLTPGGSYDYQGSLILPDEPGTYHFFCAYHTEDHIIGENGHNWEVNIDVEADGKVVEDFNLARKYREKDIFVAKKTYISAASGPASWKQIRAPWDSWHASPFGPIWNEIMIAVNPKNPKEIYVVAEHRSDTLWEDEGTKLFKSVDGGVNWKPVNNGLPRLRRFFIAWSKYYWPIGAIAIAPSNPNIIYIGTTSFSPPHGGMGIYKSINGGESWEPANGKTKPFPEYDISSMIVDPTNPDIVYVGTVGGGIWKTEDGGRDKWEQIFKPIGEVTLTVNDLAVSPTNPDIIYAADYNYAPLAVTTPVPSGAVFHGGLYRSKDGGNSWKKKYGKFVNDIIIDNKNPDIFYAIVYEYDMPGARWSPKIYKFTDGGNEGSDISGTGTEDYLPSPNSLTIDFRAKKPVIYGATNNGVYFSPCCDGKWFPIGPAIKKFGSEELGAPSIEQVIVASDSNHHILYAVATKPWERRDKRTTILFKLDYSNKAIVAKKYSPVELRVYDSQGRATGLLNGEVRSEIPGSTYGDGVVTLFSPAGSYRYEVIGTDTGSYGLDVTSVESGEATTFTATGIPITAGAVHQYTIDWDALARGEKGVMVQVDRNGDGHFEETFQTGSEFNGSAPPPGETGVNIICAPNPVGNDGTAFLYTSPAGTSTAKLMIFNVSGKPVFETPLDVNSTRFPSTGTWNPVDQDGIPLANGPYIYVLIADGKVIGQGKMVIQR